MKKNKKNWQSFPHEKNSGFFIVFFRCHLVFITIVAHNEHLDLWDKNSAIIRRKLKERNLNLSVWLDCEKRLFFVETAGVSFWFTGNSNIVKQKDATVQKRIHKGKRKKKEEISVSSKKKIIVDVVMMRAVWHLSGNDTNFVLVEFLSPEGNKGTVLHKLFFAILCGQTNSLRVSICG